MMFVLKLLVLGWLNGYWYEVVVAVADEFIVVGNIGAVYISPSTKTRRHSMDTTFTANSRDFQPCVMGTRRLIKIAMEFVPAEGHKEPSPS
jgi:hypothetical protein